jgi:lysophospholipase L1-like esterase
MLVTRVLTVVVLLAAFCQVLTAADEPGRPVKVKIALIGDSTVASYPKPPADRPDLTGWGQVFGEYFDERGEVLNFAVSGRSSKSFLREKRWQPVLDAKPAYVFIQFGHNDEKGKGDRSSDPEGDFQDHLRQYIDEARAAKAIPVLVTPVARRTFADGKPVTTLQPYADAMQKVGREKNVPVIDLHAASFELYGKLGDEGSADLTASASDRTHFSRKGGRAMARLVADAIPKAVPELAPYLQPQTAKP